MAVEHDRLLAEIKQTVSSNSEKERHLRIPALERLLKLPVVDPSRSVEVLFAMLTSTGAIEPESTLVLKYLKRAAKREPALDTLVRLILERQEGAIACAWRLLPGLNPKAQSLLAPALAKGLFQRDRLDHTTEAIS